MAILVIKAFVINAQKLGLPYYVYFWLW
jgi:hypothetical protein